MISKHDARPLDQIADELESRPPTMAEIWAALIILYRRIAQVEKEAAA